jgi:hypothetical protein
VVVVRVDDGPTLSFRVAPKAADALQTSAVRAEASTLSAAGADAAEDARSSDLRPAG